MRHNPERVFRSRLWVCLAIAAAATRASAQTCTPGSLEDGPTVKPLAAAPLTLAEYHVWHGLPSHQSAFTVSWLPNGRAYDSRDPAVIARHISTALKLGIGGFVVNWYGPGAGVANDADRRFMDEATMVLSREAERQGFKFALLYDEGTLSQAHPSNPAAYASRAAADLQYAARYFESPAYLYLQDRPALFVFPYSDVDRHLDWSALRAALPGPVSLIDQDPDPSHPAHDDLFDGFFAWVQPSGVGWDPSGYEWGEQYLHWFYSTMRSGPYAGKIAVGGVWPGFDDSLAPWGQRRFMSRQGQSVYLETAKIAARYEAPVVMVATWNDFEEGTDVEAGVAMAVDMERPAADVLLRSTPLQVRWNAARGQGVVQFYRDGRLIYGQPHASGDHFELGMDRGYEIKVWLPGCAAPFAQAIRTRNHDTIPGVTPVHVDRLD